jgi:hypothetical protein
MRLPSGSRRLRDAALGLCALAACAHAEPPTPDASPFVARAPASELAPSGASPLDAGPPAKASRPGFERITPTAPTPFPSDPATPADASAQSGQAPSGQAPSGQAPSGQAPTQTHDMPSADAASFRANAALLWRAIVDDNPAAAMPFFFPLSAYQQVKDVGDPASDWNHRLVSAFRQDIHALHAKLGGDGASATFVSLDVPTGRARWVLPGEEWNKIGYYRVFGSKLRYEAGGQSRAFDVKSLISWRGEWFVVHLTAVR